MLNTLFKENEKHNKTPQIEEIDKWWQEFAENEKKIAKRLANKSTFNIAHFMQKKLQLINENIMWEFGPAVKLDGYRLVITPESHKELRPLVKYMIAHAPILEGWEFYSYRLPGSFEHAQFTVKARTGTSLFDMHFKGDINSFNLIDLEFFVSDNLDDTQLDLILHQAFVFVETIVGEEILDKWIGAIEIKTQSVNNENLANISEFSNWVKDIIREIKENLPNKPCYQRQEDAKWIIFELKPEKKNDYIRQDDMFVGKTMYQSMWQNNHTNTPFCSERFSKSAETFCYIKIDGTQISDDEKFADKSEIEDAIDDVLISAGLGCHIGGGTGLNYSYIDLALLNIEKSIEMVKEVLRKGNITKRTWILFYDSELESQWVGIYDDTPAPPLQNFESL